MILMALAIVFLLMKVRRLRTQLLGYQEDWQQFVKYVANILPITPGPVVVSA